MACIRSVYQAGSRLHETVWESTVCRVPRRRTTGAPALQSRVDNCSSCSRAASAPAATYRLEPRLSRRGRPQHSAPSQTEASDPGSGFPLAAHPIGAADWRSKGAAPALWRAGSQPARVTQRPHTSSGQDQTRLLARTQLLTLLHPQACTIITISCQTQRHASSAHNTKVSDTARDSSAQHEGGRTQQLTAELLSARHWHWHWH